MTAAPAGLHAARIFDGEHWHEDAVLLFDGPRLRDLRPATRGLPPGVLTLPPELTLAPGFVDTQVNGGGGVLLNDAPTPAAIATIAAAHRRFGTTALLPTLITDRRDAVRAALAATEAALAAGVPGVLGLHLEGPFINPARRGVHPPDRIARWEPGDLDLLASPALRLVTLAPECVPPEAIAALVRRGVRVSLGHSDATAAQVRAAVAQGLRGATHLFNAMSPLGSREPGAVGAVLDEPRIIAGIIADGHHVSDASLRIALRCKGAAGLMLVTDAMSTIGISQQGFDLFGTPVTVVDGRPTTPDGTLAGSALDMASAVRHAVSRLGATPAEALAMAARTPAAFLGLDHELGTLRPGLRADIVALDAALHVRTTWIAGREPPAIAG
ncbi:N-acetylglucosamine-6-phosphate deacetylase [Roseomonas sp. BN140053]|uniref:N-acetylglucosamine-6-phosphate deacetylase n=1 Tax=Roseomonas sp. BN140053 TaxID=3391898 RepID=UPI0039EC88FE